MVDFTVEHQAGKKLMTIDFSMEPMPANLGNSQCLLSVRTALRKEAPDELILLKDFKKRYSSETIELIRGLDAAVDAAKAAFPADVSEADRCGDCMPLRIEAMEKIKDTLDTDPIEAYFLLLKEYYSTSPDRLACRQTLENYKKLIDPVKDALERSKVILAAKESGNKEALYSIFKAWTVPSFITSNIDPNLPKGAMVLDSYSVGSSLVRVYDVPGMAEKFYHITAPEFLIHEDENQLIQKAFDEINRQEAKILDPKKAREHFKALGVKYLEEGGVTGKRLEELSDIIARYSAGYGILEVLLSDAQLQDIFVDSPGTTPVYVYHGAFEECKTNVTLSEDDLEKLSARFRSVSGRPFDESSPVLHAELKDLNVRIAALCPPATFGGIGFAFRRSRPRPWTLAQFVNVGMMDAKTAGLLSTLVDSQASLLVTGPRGSGKTSLLASLIVESAPNFRIIVIEDTPELPVEDLQEARYKIQHIRTKPSFGEKAEGGYELSAEEALRTALRLGESVLVLGEVRGPEAKALFEAMRIGAAGNVVLGTIHGSSAYDTWDRIVNDLNVPSTSFKATDVVISCAAIRKKQSTRRTRKVISVTEVGKEWKEDPYHENGFFEMISYSPDKDKWSLSIKNHILLKRIAKNRGMTMQELLNEIDARGKLVKLMVDKARRLNTPGLLEIDAVVSCNKLYRSLVESGNYSKALKGVGRWLDEHAGKPLH